jgi:hypothetical protein
MGLGRCWPVVIADLLDVSVNDLHYLFTGSLDDFTIARTGAAEDGFRHASAVFAVKPAEVAAPVRKQSERGLVTAPHCLPTCKAAPIPIYYQDSVMKAGHEALNVVAVKGIKVPTDKLFFQGHHWRTSLRDAVKGTGIVPQDLFQRWLR